MNETNGTQSVRRMTEADRKAMQDALRSDFAAEMQRSTARALVMKEVVLFATMALVIVGAIGGIWYSYRKRSQAEKEAFAREVARREMEQTERLRLEERNRKAREDARRAQAEERARKEAERKRLQDEMNERLRAERAARDQRRKHETLGQDFRSAPFGYWKNAPKELRPQNLKTPMVFRCMFFDAANGQAFYDVTMQPGGSMKIARLSADEEAVDVPEADFTQKCTEEPYLMKAAGRVWFCPVATKKTVFHVPSEEEAFNPSQEEFGSLYQVLSDLSMRPSVCKYDVLMRTRGQKDWTKVTTVGYGVSVARGKFADIVRANLEREARQREEDWRRRQSVASSGGKTRGGNRPLGLGQVGELSPLEKWEMSRRRYYQTGTTDGNVIYRSSDRRAFYYSPPQDVLKKQRAWELRQQQMAETKSKREAARQNRQSAAEAAFRESNAVTQQAVDAVLNTAEITFRTL